MTLNERIIGSAATPATVLAVYLSRSCRRAAAAHHSSPARQKCQSRNPYFFEHVLNASGSHKRGFTAIVARRSLHSPPSSASRRSPLLCSIRSAAPQTYSNTQEAARAHPTSYSLQTRAPAHNAAAPCHQPSQPRVPCVRTLVRSPRPLRLGHTLSSIAASLELRTPLLSRGPLS